MLLAIGDEEAANGAEVELNSIELLHVDGASRNLARLDGLADWPHQWLFRRRGRATVQYSKIAAA